MESSTLGGQIRNVAREQIQPACREGRVSRLRDSVLEVRVRSLTGDLRTLPCRGYRPRVVEGSSGLELLDAVNGDPCAVIEDEGGSLWLVDWTPRG